MMKKILLSFCALTFITGTVIAAGNVYSKEYVNHLKDCSVHIEKYNAEIPTDDPAAPVLHLTSTESISGWQNGKCITKSLVFSNDLNKNILMTQCAFSEKQLDEVVKKMNAANKGDAKAKANLQNELTKYVQDNSICHVKNLLEK